MADDESLVPTLNAQVDVDVVTSAAVVDTFEDVLEHSNNTEERATEEDEEAAAAVATVGDTGSLINPNNKWAKNGFGASVSKLTGKFSKEETEVVKHSIAEFCNAKQISVARLCSECDHKAELKGAWMEIAKRLPHRSVQSVYRHGIRQCHPFKRGAWSDAEVTALSELVTTMGKKWSAIQAKLDRSADSCRDKYREMSDDYIKGRWKEEEMEELRKVICDYLNQATNGVTSSITDMKLLGKFVVDEKILIPWSTISKRMGQRSRLSCFKKWQKMTGLFNTSNESQIGKHDLDEDDDDDDNGEKEYCNSNKEEPDPKRSKVTLLDDTECAVVDDSANSHAVAELAAETVEALGLPEVDVTTKIL